MSNVVEYDATQNPVDSVTVFQADRAEVQRKITVELKDGQNDVEVKKLPSSLDEASIRVDGIGSAVIFDVIYHPPPIPSSEKHSEALLELNKRKDALSTELAILRRQADILKEYSKTLAAKDTNTDQLENFLDVYAARQHTIDAKITKGIEDLNEVEKDIKESLLKLGADTDSILKRGTSVTIVVLAEGDGTAELSLMYVVSNASWTPQYDLRAAIAPDTRSDSSVSLHYRASITQGTGEDWAAVSLTLSTASPLQGTIVPELEPYWIGEGLPPVPKSMRRRAGALGASLPHPSVAPTMAAKLSSGAASAPEKFKRREASVSDGFGGGGLAPPGFFRARDSSATEGAVSTTFRIPGLSTIPSDSEDSQQTHKVSIAEINFSAVELEWISVPKEVPSAYLQCKVKNTSKYILLPGAANVFMNNNFVAKSHIPHVSPQESFSCSLGVDPAIRITYHPQTKKSKTTGGSVLTTKTHVTLFEQGISIKNTRLSRVHRLLVKEQLPVSRDARIKVALLEPRALANSSGKSGSTVQGDASVAVSEGVRVRWVPRNADDTPAKALKLDGGASEEINVETAQGLLEWICEVAPSSVVEVLLAWEVSAPVGVEWVRQ